MMMSTQNSPANASAQERKRRTRQLSSTQVMFAVIIAIGLMLAINFSTRILADRDLRAIQNQVIAEIDELRAEQAALISERDFAQSDDYVALWARSEGRMVREGEILIVPVPLTSEVQVRPTQTFDMAEVDTTLPRPENYQLWWRLFFDSEPPQG